MNIKKREFSARFIIAGILVLSVLCLTVSMLLPVGAEPRTSTPGAAAAPPSQIAVPIVFPSEGFSHIAEAVSPAVVNIQVTQTARATPFGGNEQFREFFERFFGGQIPEQESIQRGMGSGFIIDEDGHVITNNHVIKGVADIVVRLKNGKEYKATVVGTDPNTDIALLKLQGASKLPKLTLGNSDALRVGEWVVAIGSPFGLEQTVTAGIVSAKGRVIGSGPYDDYIQTDASINPGNSGGPLLNLKGEVIGINTAIAASGQGIGFAIPSNMAQKIVAQLKSKGEVTRGWIGVAIQPLNQEMSSYYGLKQGHGALIIEVVEGGPAQKAGLRAKDVILKINGTEITGSLDATKIIADIPVGSTANLTVLREGQRKEVSIKVAKRDDQALAAMDGKGTVPPPQAQQETQFGFSAQTITPDIVRRYRLPETEGVLITGVSAKGSFAKAGVRQGDIVKEINKVSVKTAEEFVSKLNSAKKGEKIQLLLRNQIGFNVVSIEK